MTQQDDGFPYAARLARVRERMKQAAEAAGRPLSGITLIAVSKFHPLAAVAAVAACGQSEFGENYLEEAVEKQAHTESNDARLRWHFIGHLQSRKASDAAGRFVLIHTVDSIKTAVRLQKGMEARAAKENAPAFQDILIQVNIGAEAQKSGVAENDLVSLARAVEQCSLLRLLGLMCLPPFFHDAESSRPFFRRLRLLRDDLAARLGHALPHLSMGMSLDFETAIAEGATFIRVGTDIFGPRP